MAYIMPVVPRIFFCYIEPIIVSGAIYNILSHPMTTVALVLRPEQLTPNQYLYADTVDKMLAASTASMLAGFGSLATIVLWLTTDAQLVRWVVVIYALLDFCHWGGIAWALGWERISNVASWSDELRLFILLPILTLAIKVSYLAGLWGSDHVPVRIGGKKVR